MVIALISSHKVLGSFLISDASKKHLTSLLDSYGMGASEPESETKLDSIETVKVVPKIEKNELSTASGLETIDEKSWSKIKETKKSITDNTTNENSGSGAGGKSKTKTTSLKNKDSKQPKSVEFTETETKVEPTKIDDTVTQTEANDEKSGWSVWSIAGFASIGTAVAILSFIGCKSVSRKSREY